MYGIGLFPSVCSNLRRGLHLEDFCISFLFAIGITISAVPIPFVQLFDRESCLALELLQCFYFPFRVLCHFSFQERCQFWHQALWSRYIRWLFLIFLILVLLIILNAGWFLSGLRFKLRCFFHNILGFLEKFAIDLWGRITLGILQLSKKNLHLFLQRADHSLKFCDLTAAFASGLQLGICEFRVLNHEHAFEKWNL